MTWIENTGKSASQLKIGIYSAAHPGAYGGSSRRSDTQLLTVFETITQHSLAAKTARQGRR
jgi:hypothetical protein